MAPTRRDVLWLGAIAVAASQVGGESLAGTDSVSAAVADFTGGAVAADGSILLDVPEIADNGGAVPVRVEAPGARRIAVFADGNPNPGVVEFRFGALVSPSASTRIRLARSQNVIAVAEMTDGTFRRVSRRVAVTVGGCA